MGKEKHVTVYICPYCPNYSAFEKQEDLEYHLFKNHPRESFRAIAINSVREMRLTDKKWCA